MTTLYAKLIQWCIRSTWFKKWSATLGGIALGMYVQASYWKQIRDTLGIWGVDRDDWMHGLLAVAGAGCVLVSVAATLTKNKQTKDAGNGQAEGKPEGQG